MERQILQLSADGRPFYLRIDSSPFSISNFSGWRELIEATDLTTGSGCRIEANAVLKGWLEDSYPNRSYVGRDFEIRKHPQKSGKRYFEFSIKEIKVPKAGETLSNPQPVPDDTGSFSADRLS